MAVDIVAIGKWVWDIVKVWLSKKKPSDAMIDAINIRLLADELITSGISVDCFFIVMVHNHGGKLRPDNFMFWSIIDGSFDEVLMPDFKYKNFQLINTDIDFLQLARRIYEQKGVAVTVDQLNKGQLKTSYEYLGLKYLRFFYLKQDKRAMWFIMVGTVSANETLDHVTQEGKIFIAVNAVKNIIRGY